MVPVMIHKLLCVPRKKKRKEEVENKEVDMVNVTSSHCRVISRYSSLFTLCIMYLHISEDKGVRLILFTAQKEVCIFHRIYPSTRVR